MITLRERQIGRELCVIYSIYLLLILMGEYMSLVDSWDRGSVPEWIAALVTLSAVLVAAIGIIIQRQIAKKRAAIDFFLKTEADSCPLEAYEKLWQGIRIMNDTALASFLDINNEKTREHYFAIRRYLNIIELMAVGIKNGMFDDKTCYDYWARIVFECVEYSKPVIEHARSTPGHEGTYVELESLAIKWKRLEARLAAG